MAPSRLRDFGERRVVAELLRPRYRDQLAYGDDCAVVALPAQPCEVVLTTDPCPFPLVCALGSDSLYHWGWLLATINFSDLAAAGATPAGLMTSYILAPDLAIQEFEALLDGVDDCCALHDARVLGGNIKDGTLQLTATAVGWCESGRRVGRSGARPGDVAVLIGCPGMLWAFALVERGFATVADDDYRALAAAATRPRAKIRAGRALATRGLARAAIDVSDGVYAALTELCRTNGCGFDLQVHGLQLPVAVAGVARQARVDTLAMLSLWGDWNIVVVVEERHVADSLRAIHEEGDEARVLGVFTRGDTVRLTSPDGTAEVWEGNEFERFSPDSWSGEMLNRILGELLDSAAQ
jgi:thiamine-monophosphate kinase